MGLGDKSGHRAGTWGGFRGQAWWIRTRESDLQGLTWGHGTGARVVTWRDYWLISSRKADRLECVPACVYQCHYVRASVLQRGTYECVHLIMYLCLRVYMILYVAIALGYVSLMCLYASLFGVPRGPLSGARSDPLSGAPSEPRTCQDLPQGLVGAALLKSYNDRTLT